MIYKFLYLLVHIYEFEFFEIFFRVTIIFNPFTQEKIDFKLPKVSKQSIILKYLFKNHILYQNIDQYIFLHQNNIKRYKYSIE